MIGAQSVRKKYLLLFINGRYPEDSCIWRMQWQLVVTTEVDSKLQNTCRNVERLLLVDPQLLTHESLSLILEPIVI